MSSSNNNKGLVQRFFTEVWNGRKTDLLDSLLQFPYEIENLLTDSQSELLRGEAIETHILEWFEAFPNLEVLIPETIAEGEKVFVETRYAGTHLDAYRGIEATGNRVDVELLAVFKIVSGKLAGHVVMVVCSGTTTSPTGRSLPYNHQKSLEQLLAHWLRLSPESNAGRLKRQVCNPMTEGGKL
jgi:predicted ester cyclase